MAAPAEIRIVEYQIRWIQDFDAIALDQCDRERRAPLDYHGTRYALCYSGNRPQHHEARDTS